MRTSWLGLLVGSILSFNSFAYEICTPENDYLESLLSPRTYKKLPPTLPKACVEAAQLSLAPTGYYGFCADDYGFPSRSHRRPCVSENYVTSVQQAVVAVTDCFGYDPLLAFATFNLESAVHLNAVGAATDIGVGQLTKSAIDEVNLNALDRARRAAAASLKYSCRKILPFMTASGSDRGVRCSFMSLPNNPEKNVIYSILLLQQNRRVINNLWNRFSIQLPDTIDVERLKVLLTMLAYNAGPGSVMSVLRAYVDQMGTNLNLSHFDFHNTAADSFVTYVNNYFPSSDMAVRRRVSKYVAHVINAARRADGLAGGTRQCLHPTYFETPAAIPEPGPVPTPSSVMANILVTKYLESALEALPRRKDCATAKHDILFNFLPRDGRPEDLPAPIYDRYLAACAAKN